MSMTPFALLHTYLNTLTALSHSTNHNNQLRFLSQTVSFSKN